jgi:DNA-binding response OmpR family regulator
MKAHILLVEDDAGLRQSLSRVLHCAGYQVTQAIDGVRAVGLLSREGRQRVVYDVLVVDIVLGEVDGLEVARVARRQPAPERPEVIMLTAHGSLQTALEAMRAGTFDYLLKPCRPEHLIERIAAALAQRAERLRHERAAEMCEAMAELLQQFQRSEHVGTSIPTFVAAAAHGAVAPQQRHLEVGELHIDTHRHEATFRAHPLHLTPIEFGILSYLAATPERVVPYSEIAQATHATNIDPHEARALLGRHIRNLRHKLDARYLVNVRGVGYMLATPEAAESEE